MAKKRYVQVGVGGRARFFYDAIAKDYSETSELVAFCDVNKVRMEYAKEHLMKDFNYQEIALYGAEAAGHGLDTEEHAATFAKGRPGILHGALMNVLQDRHGQIMEAFSISAGLDYPGVGPEHCHFKDIGRATYDSITDDEALEAFMLLSRLEGIIPALESSHAVALTQKVAKELGPDKAIIVCLSGRGDKDVVQVKERLEAEGK